MKKGGAAKRPAAACFRADIPLLLNDAHFLVVLFRTRVHGDLEELGVLGKHRLHLGVHRHQVGLLLEGALGELVDKIGIKTRETLNKLL